MIVQLVMLLAHPCDTAASSEADKADPWGMMMFKGASTPAFMGMSVPDMVRKQYKRPERVMASGALKFAKTSGPVPVKSNVPVPLSSMSILSLTTVPSSK